MERRSTERLYINMFDSKQESKSDAPQSGATASTLTSEFTVVKKGVICEFIVEMCYIYDVVHVLSALFYGGGYDK